MRWMPKSGRKLNSGVLAAEGTYHEGTRGMVSGDEPASPLNPAPSPSVSLSGDVPNADEHLTLKNPQLIFSAFLHHRQLALAVSGGSDSVALLHLAADWRRTTSPTTRLIALTVDHRLRQEAAQEAEQVRAWCKALDVDHHVLVWSQAYLGPGLQARARQARYDLMSNWCEAAEVGTLLTGHTLDDQAETVAMRLKRTQSNEALSGIWRERPWGHVMVHRPLLDFRRGELRHYLQQRGQGWIDDPSNEAEVFERVRVRAALSSVRDAHVRDLARRATVAATLSATLRASATAWASQHLSIFAQGYVSLPTALFSCLTEDLQTAVLKLVIHTSGGTSPHPDPLERVRLWVQEPFIPGSRQRRSLSGVLFAKRQASLLVAREAGRIPTAAVEMPRSGSLLWDGRFIVKAESGRVVVAFSHPQWLPAIDAPLFVRQGWPLVLSPQGNPCRAEISFIPYLRDRHAWN